MAVDQMFEKWWPFLLMIGEAFSSSPLVCVYLHLTKFEFMCVPACNPTRKTLESGPDGLLLIEKHNLWKFVSPRKAVY